MLYVGFLLTRPSRDVTHATDGYDRKHAFLLTRPSRDVTFDLVRHNSELLISTHTSLAGRDMAQLMPFRHPQDFYSHVPRGT